MCDLQIDHIMEACTAATFGLIRFLWKDWEVLTFSAHMNEGQEMTAWLEGRTDAWHRITWDKSKRRIRQHESNIDLGD